VKKIKGSVVKHIKLADKISMDGVNQIKPSPGAKKLSVRIATNATEIPSSATVDDDDEVKTAKKGRKRKSKKRGKKPSKEVDPGLFFENI
jgi:hypothetical protein